MNVYTCTYTSMWVGGTAVVVAPDRFVAADLLKKAARKSGASKLDVMSITPERMQLLDLTEAAAYVLSNGDY